MVTKYDIIALGLVGSGIALLLSSTNRVEREVRSFRKQFKGG